MTDYSELVRELRENASNSRDLYIADAIEELESIIPHKCFFCVGCEVEPMDGSGCENGFVLSIRRAQEALAKMETTNPKWIPVTERLPEKNTWVLAYCKYKGYVIDYLDINGLWSYGNVTHWMPLPEPSKEGEG